MTLKTRRIFQLTLRVIEESELFTDDEPPSLTGEACVQTTGETLSETIRPLAKVIPFAAKLKRLA